MKSPFLFILNLAFFFSYLSSAQEMEYKLNSNNYWQQRADYNMEIDMDVQSYKYTGTQTVVYTNNSPDVLNNVYYHLYFNAFQPNSEMDARAKSIADPDRRLVNNLGTKKDPIYESRISKLKKDEIGYIDVKSLQQNGEDLNYEVAGTILEVKLNKPIQPGELVTFKMVFEGQVPVQIRRSGRNNKEGVALSMSQWYPKLAEYDTEGWHAYPYIAREFYGVWGNYDVKITIDKDYVLGGTGYLQNPNEIGHGYETSQVITTNNNTLTWHFKAPNVHDFTWAADPDYAHDTMQVPDGPLMHFLYKKTMDSININNWKRLQPKAVELMQYYSELVGKYPYEQYSIIQGGDGGMEYGMCTLVSGKGNFDGLFRSTVSHELAHTWFQFLIATNEAKDEWMDEGFATYIEYKAMDYFYKENKTNPWEKSYAYYYYIVNSGNEQPQTTYADHYNINRAYSIASYYKGAVFLAQLGYIIGEENLDKTIKQYFKTWAYKHPKPNDFIRVAEKVSGLELDWYLVDFTQTTNTIDYAIKNIDKKTITLQRIGLMPMPLDITVTYKDGSTEDFYIPLREMRGAKPTSATILPDWAWAYPTYTFKTSKKIEKVEIDPKEFMADINKDNNLFPEDKDDAE